MLSCCSCLPSLCGFPVLADSRYFQDDAFVNYLRYLLYWKEPRYAKYLIYPQCLHFLELLQDPLFRSYCANQSHVDFIAHQVANHWKFYRNNRLETAAAAAAAAMASTTTTNPAGGLLPSTSNGNLANPITISSSTTTTRLPTSPS